MLAVISKQICHLNLIWIDRFLLNQSREQPIKEIDLLKLVLLNSQGHTWILTRITEVCISPIILACKRVSTLLTTHAVMCFLVRIIFLKILALPIPHQASAVGWHALCWRVATSCNERLSWRESNALLRSLSRPTRKFAFCSGYSRGLVHLNKEVNTTAPYQIPFLAFVCSTMSTIGTLSSPIHEWSLLHIYHVIIPSCDFLTIIRLLQMI